MLGIFGYMLTGEIRARDLGGPTDLFSFGAVLYEMATGALPFRGESSAVIFREILDRTPVPAVRLNPDVPPKLEEIIQKSLEKDRDLRYQHASDIRTDLQRLKRTTTPGGIPDARDTGSRGGPGHWDVNDGSGRKNGGRQRYDPDGRSMPEDVAHPPGWRPIWAPTVPIPRIDMHEVPLIPICTSCISSALP
jgi:serine/threonine protein kinase